MSEAALTFVLCVDNTSYAASLEPRKAYQVLEDAEANLHRLVRVLDESGKDYLFPAPHFVPVTLPEAAERRLG